MLPIAEPIQRLAAQPLFSGDGQVTGLQQQCLGADVIHVERRQQLPGAHHVAHRHRRDAAFEQRVDQKRRRAGLEPVRLEFVATQQQQSAGQSTEWDYSGGEQ